MEPGRERTVGWQLAGTEMGVPTRWCETSKRIVTISNVAGARLWIFENGLAAGAA
jgi:hypothetical protein